ncbi:hypothetical protein ACKWTF_013831 [Chironomus riparius]
MKNNNNSTMNEEVYKFVAPQPPRKHDSKKSEKQSSESHKKSKSSSSSRHHSCSSKQLSSTNERSKDKENKKSKSSENKHHKSSSSSKSHKRDREDVESKDNEPNSKKIKSDHEKLSSRSSKSSSSSKSLSHKTEYKELASPQPSTTKAAQNILQTPELLTQKPKLDLSPDLVNDLNTSVSNFDYRQLPSNSNSIGSISMLNQHKQTESDLLTKSISSIKSRTKIYSGNSRGRSNILKLTEMCLKVLTDNLDFVGCIGDIPFDILRPALEKAKPDQLTKIEYYNPYLLDDSDILWKTICQRKWRNRQPMEMESWREMYERCNKEDEEKLNRLKQSIRQTTEKSSNCVQKTKIAFVDTIVKAPRVVKKQETFSSNRRPVISLAARIETLKNLKPNVLASSDVRSRLAASVQAGAQPIVRQGTIQRTSSVKTAPMMAKLLSKFRR